MISAQNKRRTKKEQKTCGSGTFFFFPGSLIPALPVCPVISRCFPSLHLVNNSSGASGYQTIDCGDGGGGAGLSNTPKPFVFGNQYLWFEVIAFRKPQLDGGQACLMKRVEPEQGQGRDFSISVPGFIWSAGCKQQSKRDKQIDIR